MSSVSDYSLTKEDYYCFDCSLDDYDDCDDFHPQCKRSHALGLRMRPETPKAIGPARKTTPEIDEEIRRRYAAGGIFGKELAQDYGVSTALIYTIIRLER